MSSSSAKMAAPRMKASLQYLLHGHHRSTTATATARLTNNAAESSMVHPFAIQVPPFPGFQPSENGSVPAFDVRNHFANWFGAQEIRRLIPSALESVPALYQSRVNARGGPVKIDDDHINSDDEDGCDSDEVPHDSENFDDYDDDDCDETDFSGDDDDHNARKKK